MAWIAVAALLFAPAVTRARVPRAIPKQSADSLQDSQEARDKEQEKRDREQEARDREQEKRDREQEARDRACRNCMTTAVKPWMMIATTEPGRNSGN